MNTRNDLSKLNKYNKSQTVTGQISFSIIASTLALGPNQAPVHWVTVAASQDLKRSGHEADHPPSANSELKNG
jgi:hypothetical protein